MLSSRFFCTTLLLAALAPHSVADILTVGPTGSGAQFTQIQAAVNAAADDDVILVKPGSYQAIVVAKPLRILGDGTGNVFLDSSVVRDIGAGEEVVLSAIHLFATPPSVLLQNCSGTVVLQDVFVFTAGDSMTGVRIENCRRALLLDSNIRSGIFGPNRGGAVSAQDSEVWIANSEINGTNTCCFATRASHAVEVVNSTLHVWRSRIRGGNGAAKQGCGTLADGGIGIKAVGSTVNLFGGPTALVSGGGGFVDCFGEGQNYPGGPGMDLSQNSHARIQRDLPVSGGFDGEGLVQAPAIVVDGSSSSTLDPKVFPTLVSSAQQTQLGSTFTLRLEGNPGGYQVLWLSVRTGPTATFRGVDGFGLLDRTQIFKVASEVLPPSAAHTHSFHVPNLPALLGSTLFFQAAERFPNGLGLRHTAPVNGFAIGNPLLVTITG